MTLYRKVQKVERVFRQLERDVASFQRATGLRCLVGCGKCCHKADISASPLEFLPLAYHLFREGHAEAWYERLTESTSNNLCVNLKPFLKDSEKGFCDNYLYRGLICRLFGYSAMLDKHAKPLLVTCKPIKEEMTEVFEMAQQQIDEGLTVPVMRNYYFQLSAIDPLMASQMLPINQAILEAIKMVLSYYSYRKPRKRKAA